MNRNRLERSSLRWRFLVLGDGPCDHPSAYPPFSIFPNSKWRGRVTYQGEIEETIRVMTESKNDGRRPSHRIRTKTMMPAMRAKMSRS